MKKRIFCTLLTLLLAIANLSVTCFASADGKTSEWEISKSKTASQLNKDLESEVILSLPAADYSPTVAISFVLDGSVSTDEDDLAARAAELLDDLSNIKNLEVLVSLTIFGGKTPILEDTGLKDLSAPGVSEELKSKLTDPAYDKMEGRSGSNLQAGVETASKHLEEKTYIAASNKYLIILTDGAARMWYKNGKAMSQTYWPPESAKVFWNNNDDFIDRYKINELRTFEEVWQAGQTGVSIDQYSMTEEQKDNATRADVADWETVLHDENYYSTYEVATYYAATAIMAAKQSENVILVSYPYHTGETYGTYTEDFKAWLAKNGITRYDTDEATEAEIFEGIEDQMIHLVDKGSYVIDEIGKNEDGNNPYNFDLVRPETMRITVGQEILTAETIAENTYGFGIREDNTYRYTVTYQPETETQEESFRWNINEAITVDRTVSLTYTVRLTPPQNTSGTAVLYTNNKATLYPIDSLGGSGTPEEFENPTVSYTAVPDDQTQEEGSVKNPHTADGTSGWLFVLAFLSAGIMLVTSRKVKR